MNEAHQPDHDRYRIGCCGWRAARARYFSQFSVIELQDTFYELPAKDRALPDRRRLCERFRRTTDKPRDVQVYEAE